MKEKYTTLLFDADNTLLDFDKAENEALKKVMTDYKLHITEENCRRYSEINDALWKKFEKGEIEKARTRMFVLSYRVSEIHHFLVGTTSSQYPSGSAMK